MERGAGYRDSDRWNSGFEAEDSVPGGWVGGIGMGDSEGFILVRWRMSPMVVAAGCGGGLTFRHATSAPFIRFKIRDRRWNDRGISSRSHPHGGVDTPRT